MNKAFFIKNKKGFGLLEVLLSVVIVATVLGVLVFTGKAAMNNSGYMQERAQAIYLAQEGIETIRQMRDTNWIDKDNTTQWNSMVWDARKFDPITSGWYKLNDLSNEPFRSRKRFGLAGPSASNPNAFQWEAIPINSVNFKRAFEFSSPGNLIPNADSSLTAYSIVVKAVVQWNNAGQTKTIEVSEILTNWRPNF
ncbi:MAG: type II secretion system protein [Bacteroidota bacterium]|nr:type II secretion system protein [Bacteroidota bacterium]